MALAASGLDPDALHLEIPEGYAMQNLDRAVEALRGLRALGVHLTIDGFGAGFSSLAHLRRLPVDTLKIDLSFVRGATTDPNDASVVTAVIAVAHSLDLRVVAQGVETEAQVALLRSLGCDEVQGFLWSPPASGRTSASRSSPAAASPRPRWPRRRRAAWRRGGARAARAGVAREPRGSGAGSPGRLALEPGRAVGVVLLLPDRHPRLERVDGEAAGGEGLVPVGRRHGHRDARRPRSRAGRGGARAAPR